MKNNITFRDKMRAPVEISLMKLLAIAGALTLLVANAAFQEKRISDLEESDEVIMELFELQIDFNQEVVDALS